MPVRIQQAVARPGRGDHSGHGRGFHGRARRNARQVRRVTFKLADKTLWLNVDGDCPCYRIGGLTVFVPQTQAAPPPEEANVPAQSISHPFYK